MAKSGRAKKREGLKRFLLRRSSAKSVGRHPAESGKKSRAVQVLIDTAKALDTQTVLFRYEALSQELREEAAPLPSPTGRAVGRILVTGVEADGSRFVIIGPRHVPPGRQGVIKSDLVYLAQQVRAEGLKVEVVEGGNLPAWEYTKVIPPIRAGRFGPKKAPRPQPKPEPKPVLPQVKTETGSK